MGDSIKITRKGRVVGELPVERIPLDYPELSSRPSLEQVHLCLFHSGSSLSSRGFSRPFTRLTLKPFHSGAPVGSRATMVTFDFRSR